MDYVLGVDVYSDNRPGDQIDDPNLKPEVKAALKAAQWRAVFNEGVRFVFVKASQGFYADRVFAETWREAKDASLLRGAYHFFHAELDVAKQVSTFIQTVGADKGELPPVLDLEPILDKKGNSPWPKGKNLLARVKEWLDRVETAFGRKPIIYTSAQIIRSHEIVNPAWGLDYPIWVAQYPWMPGTKKEYSDPHNPPQWSSGYPEQPQGYKPWSFWQFTEVGQMNGFGGEGVDINMFKGSLDDLYKFAGVGPLDIGKVVDDSSSNNSSSDNTSSDGGKSNSNIDTNYDLYTVVAGDTLWALSQRFGVKLDDIVKLNNITNPDLIVVGQVLKIPKSASGDDTHKTIKGHQAGKGAAMPD